MTTSLVSPGDSTASELTLLTGPDTGGSGGGAVSSVFGRTGAVVAVNGDYSFSQIAGMVAPGQLPVFTSTAKGAVPPPGASTPVNYVLQANGAWVAPAAGGGGTTVSPTPPASPVTGQLWWDDVGGQLYVWTGSQWVAASCCSGGGSGGGGGSTIGPTPPASPVPGELWWDNVGGQLYVWTGTEWAAASCCSGGGGGGGGSGTVTSVAATVPTGLAVSGSPITTSGTLAFTWSGTIPPAQIPLFSSSANGGVVASGGGTANFLRADGTWAAPPGGTAPVTSVFGRTGVVVSANGDYAFSQISGQTTLAQLPSIANNTVLGNVSGSTATPIALTQAQLTALIQNFTATTAGDVPASGGGSSNFLRADGIWAVPAGTGGGTVNSVAMTVPTGLAVAGSPITNTGTLAVTWSGTIPAAQVPTFTPTVNGGVPSSGGGTTNFLRADGTWAAPAGASGANPTASVGLAVVNGVATTFMRSDAAPPLAQNIAPTWTGAHTFTAAGPQVTLGATGGNAGSLAVKGSTSGIVTIQPGAAAAGTYNLNLPTSAGTAGQVLTSQGGLAAAMTWTTPTVGTVTSVAMTVPAGLAVSGSAITTSGTLGLTWSGTIPNAQVPAPTVSALGGVISSNAPANQFATGITTAGAVTYAQPAFSNLSGSATLAQLPTIANNTVLGNVSGSTAVPAALTQTQLTALIQNFTATTAGDVPSSGGGTTNFLRADGTWAAPPGGGLTPIANNTVLGNVSGATATPTALSQAQLTALISVFTSTLSGAVPAPGSAPANALLGANGVWQGGSLQAGSPPSTPVSGQLWWDNVGGQLYVWYGTTWVAASCCTGGGSGGSGTVTSVAMTVPSGLAIAGSPITTSGTLGVTWSGTIPASSLPAPTTSTLGGVQAVTAVAHQWVASISTAGVPALTQPAFTDISGSVAATQMPALTGAITSTAGTVATTLSAGAVAYTNIATAAIATAAQIQSDTVNLLLKTDASWGAVTPVSTATTGAITLNLSTGIHFVPSAALTGNVTFTFSNIKAGQCGIIALQAGSFTVSWGGTMILPGGTAPAANTSGYTLYFYWALNTTTVAVNKVL